MKPPPLQPFLRPGASVAAGRYELVRELGVGGNGVVWLARQSSVQQHVAIKFSHLAEDDASVLDESIQHEVASLVAFSASHPNIVNLLDAGYHHGRRYVVMQFLANGSLQDYIFGSALSRSEQAQCLRSSPKWLECIADALDHIHRSGFVHRDVKPANILLDESLSAYLADFGIAVRREEQEGGILERIWELVIPSRSPSSLAGTLPYISPEVLRGEPPSPSSDQYSLAVTLYHFFASRFPYEGETRDELLQSHAAGKRHPLRRWHPDFPSGLDRKLGRALETDPTARFDSCMALARAVSAEWPSSPAAATRSISISSDTTARPSSDRDAFPAGPKNKPPLPESKRRPPKKIDLGRIFRDNPRE